MPVYRYETPQPFPAGAGPAVQAPSGWEGADVRPAVRHPRRPVDALDVFVAAVAPVPPLDAADVRPFVRRPRFRFAEAFDLPLPPRVVISGWESLDRTFARVARRVLRDTGVGEFAVTPAAPALAVGWDGAEAGRLTLRRRVRPSPDELLFAPTVVTPSITFGFDSADLAPRRRRRLIISRVAPAPATTATPQAKALPASLRTLLYRRRRPIRPEQPDVFAPAPAAVVAVSFPAWFIEPRGPAKRPALRIDRPDLLFPITAPIQVAAYGWEALAAAPRRRLPIRFEQPALFFPTLAPVTLGWLEEARRLIRRARIRADVADVLFRPAAPLIWVEEAQAFVRIRRRPRRPEGEVWPYRPFIGPDFLPGDWPRIIVPRQDRTIVVEFQDRNIVLREQDRTIEVEDVGHTIIIPFQPRTITDPKMGE